MGILLFILLCGIEIGGAAYALKQNETLWKELDEKSRLIFQTVKPLKECSFKGLILRSFFR